MKKMKKKPNKRNKQKKTYIEIAIEKQVNTSKIRKANYEDDNNQEETNRVLAKNRHRRWR